MGSMPLIGPCSGSWAGLRPAPPEPLTDNARSPPQVGLNVGGYYAYITAMSKLSCRAVLALLRRVLRERSVDFTWLNQVNTTIHR